MNINERLKNLEQAVAAMQTDGERVVAVREFRRVNPDADYLLGRLAAIAGTNNPSRFFADIFGVVYDPDLTWAQNVERVSPPPSTVPPETFEALKAIGTMSEFLAMFGQTPANATTLDQATEATGTSDPIQMLAHDAGTTVRRAFGAFCHENRIRFPGAKLIHFRHGRNIVTINDGTLRQMFADTDIENQLTAGATGKENA
jgi:hypothetical protein